MNETVRGSSTSIICDILVAKIHIINPFWGTYATLVFMIACMAPLPTAAAVLPVL